MFTAYPQHIHTVLFTITLPSILTLLLHMLSFSQYDIFSQLLHNWLYNNVYGISLTYTYSTVYNYTTQYTECAFTYASFSQCDIFLNYYIIHYTTVFTAYPQHIHTVLFTITVPSRLTLLFIYASFTQCDIFPQLLHNWLYNNISSISSTYTYGIVYNYTTQSTEFAVYRSFLYTMWYFFTITHNWLCNNVYSITATYTHGNVYNYTTQYTGFAVYICFPFHNVIFFDNYLTIDSTSIFPAYPQHILTILFTITLPSILTLLFIYASFTQCDIFPQLLHNWLYNNISSISSTYTYDIVYNYTSQYNDFAVYISFLYTMWYFFTITAQLTLQQCLQHIRNIYIR